MPKPQIDGIYEVYSTTLNAGIITREKIPVRVLSGTRWIVPKVGRSVQPHQAVSARKFRIADYRNDRETTFPEGLLVCWVQEPGKPGDLGLRAATGPDAVRRLRALDRPDLARYRDFLYGAAKEHSLQIDVVNAPHLTSLITEETGPVTTTASTGTTMTVTRRPHVTKQVEFWADVENGPVVTVHGITHHGKEFQVTRVRLLFRPVDGYWVCQNLQTFGLMLKKDGSVGKAEAHNDYPVDDKAPAWVHTIVDRFTPAEPAPVIPTQGFSLTLES